MSLRVEIERAVFDLGLQPLINTLIDKAKNSDSLTECYDQFLNLKEDGRVSYGKGGSHIWVSQRNKRILLITEK